MIEFLEGGCTLAKSDSDLGYGPVSIWKGFDDLVLITSVAKCCTWDMPLVAVVDTGMVMRVLAKLKLKI